MSDIQMLRLFVNERISSVAEEILNVFIKTLLQYQQQIDLQRKQLDLVDPVDLQRKQLDLVDPVDLQRKQLDLVDPPSDVKAHPSDFHHLPVDEEEEEEVPLPPERWEERSSGLSQEKDPKCPPHREDTEPPLASSSTEGHDMRAERGDEEVEFCAASQPAGHLESTLDDHLFSSDCSEAESEEEDDNDGNYKDDGGEEPAESRLNAVKTKMTTRPESPRPSPVGDKTSAALPVDTKWAGEAESRCKVCRQSFPDAVSLRRHVRFHHNDCGLCGKHLEPAENLKLHLQVHRTCTTCGKAFPTNYAMEKHAKTHRGEKPYTCAVCQLKFTESGTLKIHMRCHTADETESRCKVCRQSFPDPVSLRRHVRFHYNDCGLCGKHLEPTENLKLHLQVHRTCTVCGKAFPTNSALEKHTRTHTGEKPYTCTVCQQRFTESGTLKIHMRSHTGERPFDCKFCGKGFSRQANLNAHVRVHTGEKPFVCTVCDQRFCRSQYLKIHMRRHMGEKPFGCTVCIKRFPNNETLKGHMRSHTGEKPFVCAFCQKGFSLRENLKVHMRVHTGEKPYVCTLCRQSFRRKESLKAHVAASHAEVKVEVESSRGAEEEGGL